MLNSISRLVVVGALVFAGPLAQADGGVSKSTITIGQSLGLTGPFSPLAVPFHQGAKMYFDRINSAGGVHGRKIELLTLDDGGNPTVTVANTQKLLEQGVLSLFGYNGSPQVTAAYPLIKDSDVLLFAPMAAADEFRGPLYPNVYSIRPGYSEEAATIGRHAATLGVRKLAIVHAKDGESMAALDAAERALPSQGADLLAKAPLDAINKTLSTGPQSVLVIGESGSAATAVRELRANGFRGPIYDFSNTGESLLAELLGPAGAGVVVARVVPNSDRAKIAVVRELYVDTYAALLGKPNVFMLEGYIAARVYIEALRRAGREPNRARLKKALEALDNFDVGGFRVHFAKERVGSKLVELSLIDSQGRIQD